MPDPTVGDIARTLRLAWSNFYSSKARVRIAAMFVVLLVIVVHALVLLVQEDATEAAHQRGTLTIYNHTLDPPNVVLHASCCVLRTAECSHARWPVELTGRAPLSAILAQNGTGCWRAYDGRFYTWYLAPPSRIFKQSILVVAVWVVLAGLVLAVALKRRRVQQE